MGRVGKHQGRGQIDKKSIFNRCSCRAEVRTHNHKSSYELELTMRFLVVFPWGRV